MQFKVAHEPPPAVTNYSESSITIARTFTKSLYKELGDFIKAAILFGRGQTDKSDIDVLIVLDDVNVTFSPELTQTYRILVEKTVLNTSKKLHITSLKFTTFWEYVRAGDPVIINILRNGTALVDHGFFAPLQMLLRQGRIRPSQESVYNYIVRAPNTLGNAKWHVLQGTLDLYWAVIDAAHAALMSQGHIPTAPEHVANMIHEHLVKKRIIHNHYASIMDKFYKLGKKIVHRELSTISGKEFDQLYKEAEDFVNTMKSVVQKTTR